MRGEGKGKRKPYFDPCRRGQDVGERGKRKEEAIF